MSASNHGSNVSRAEDLKRKHRVVIALTHYLNDRVNLVDQSHVEHRHLRTKKKDSGTILTKLHNLYLLHKAGNDATMPATIDVAIDSAKLGDKGYYKHRGRGVFGIRSLVGNAMGGHNSSKNLLRRYANLIAEGEKVGIILDTACEKLLGIPKKNEDNDRDEDRKEQKALGSEAMVAFEARRKKRVEQKEILEANQNERVEADQNETVEANQKEDNLDPKSLDDGSDDGLEEFEEKEDESDSKLVEEESDSKLVEEESDYESDEELVKKLDYNDKLGRSIRADIEGYAKGEHPNIEALVKLTSVWYCKDPAGLGSLKCVKEARAPQIREELLGKWESIIEPLELSYPDKEEANRHLTKLISDFANADTSDQTKEEICREVSDYSNTIFNNFAQSSPGLESMFLELKNYASNEIHNQGGRNFNASHRDIGTVQTNSNFISSNLTNMLEARLKKMGGSLHGDKEPGSC